MNDKFNKEKELIISYLERKSLKRGYSDNYLNKKLPLVEKMFSLLKFNFRYDLFDDIEVKKAKDFAFLVHNNTERKYINLAYENHVEEVALIVSSIKGYSDTDVKNAIMASFLHDVVEKGELNGNKVEEKDVLNITNKDTCIYVDYLTDKIKYEEGSELNLSREDRILKNFNKFTECPDIVNNIKIADIISNNSSIILCDSLFSEVYLKPIHDYMLNYFINNDKVDINLKGILKEQIEISKEVIQLNKEFNIQNIDKNYIKKLKNEKKKNKLK